MPAAVLKAALAACPRPVLLASATGWLVLAFGDRGLAFASYCGAFAEVPVDSWPSLVAAMVVNPPSALAALWLLMLAAMMPPLLAGELRFLWNRTLARRRLRSVALFVLGYVGVWLPAGAVLIGSALVLRALTGTASAAFFLTLCIALAWQASPAKKASLNRCHRRPRLAAFGARADRDCLRYGVSAGVACLGACWALMLVTVSVETYHLPLMLLGAALALVERQTPARAKPLFEFQ